MNKPVVKTRNPWTLGTWAWLGNRIAGGALIFYLMVHIMVISSSQLGEQNFNNLMATMHEPIPLTMEILLILAVVFHGMNGVRHVLIDFAVCGPRKQVALLWGVVSISCVVFIISIAIFAPMIMHG